MTNKHIGDDNQMITINNNEIKEIDHLRPLYKIRQLQKNEKSSTTQYLASKLLEKQVSFLKTKNLPCTQITSL